MVCTVNTSSADRSAARRTRPAAPAADDRRILYEIIRTVASTVDLDHVLGAIVRLVTEGTQAHACFVFISEGGGSRLVLRAASEPYRHALGRASMRRGEGLAGWVAEHRRPAFIPDNALADPRIKYFPELDEEKYQSIVSVPLIGKDDEVIGVIALHAEAPRVFDEEDAAFVIHSASLVANAIENARLYAAARRRVRELERLSALSESISAAGSLEDLLPDVATQALALMRAEAVHVYLVEANERLRRRASAPASAEAPSTLGLSDLSAELRRTGRGNGTGARAPLGGALWGGAANAATLTTPLAADGEVLGFFVARGAAGRSFDDDDRDLATSIAAQTAVGIKKIRLIEGLEERNLIKDFFADLIAGRRREGLGGRARRLGCDLDQPKLALVAVPWRGEPRTDAEVAQAMDRFEHACGRALPGVLFDRRDELTRGLVPALGGDERESLKRLQRALTEGGAPLPLVVGVSSPCVGTEAIATGFEEAQQAARAAPVITSAPAIVPFDGLGPYKYLLRVPADDRVRDRHREALRRLLDYDRARQAQLTRTLEEFLRQRGNISATAQALYVHPNTLRQRLRRIADLTQIDVRTDDWLMIEIALKLLKLEEALDRP